MLRWFGKEMFRLCSSICSFLRETLLIIFRVMRQLVSPDRSYAENGNLRLVGWVSVTRPTRLWLLALNPGGCLLVHPGCSELNLLVPKPRNILWI